MRSEQIGEFDLYIEIPTMYSHSTMAQNYHEEKMMELRCHRSACETIFEAAGSRHSLKKSAGSRAHFGSHLVQLVIRKMNTARKASRRMSFCIHPGFFPAQYHEMSAVNLK
jgi:hypothetical protein